MWIPLLLSVVLATPTGTITGSIAPPQNVRLTKAAQVVVLSGEYVNLYAAEVQKRLDNAWEDYKPAFIQDKQAFLIFRDLALRRSYDSILNRMRRDSPVGVANFVHNATNNTFEFKNVPQGECRVLALVSIGNQEFVWGDSVILINDTPATITLKPYTP